MENNIIDPFFFGEPSVSAEKFPAAVEDTALFHIHTLTVFQSKLQYSAPPGTKGWRIS
jgi:hypothetical protein